MKRRCACKIYCIYVLLLIYCTQNTEASAVDHLKKAVTELNTIVDLYNTSTIFDVINIANVNLTDSANDQLKSIQYTDPASLIISGKISGTWFDPSHDGEGISIEILDKHTAVINWFTYDKSGQQAWIIGTGKIIDNTISVENALIPTGGVFGSSFNPEFINHNKWGSLFFEFSDCNLGAVYYEGSPEFGSGSLFLQRLTSISGLHCDQALQEQNQLSGLGLITGLWYNPARDGEGFLIEILDKNNALAYWYTYDYFGNQVWVLGAGKISGRTITINNATFTKGGIFGPEFNPDTVERTKWGKLTFQFSSCKTATVEHESIAGFEPGVIELSRLTSIENNLCNQQPVIDLSGQTMGTGKITLDWVAPDLRVDGTTLPITDISEYILYFGNSERVYTHSFPISADYNTSITVTGLKTGEHYYIAVTTRDTNGLESSYLLFPKKRAR